jgi:hypothetical protein
VTCASAHSPIHDGRGEGGSTTQREREGALEATAQQLANRAREAKREEKRTGEEIGADRSAPVGRERERERACGRESCR